MLTLKPSTPPPPPFPWQRGRACHEDRAMGLELELTELVRRRDLAEADGLPTQALEAQIEDVMADLAAEAVLNALS
jgi:hypothetical protein